MLSQYFLWFTRLVRVSPVITKEQKMLRIKHYIIFLLLGITSLKAGILQTNSQDLDAVIAEIKQSYSHEKTIKFEGQDSIKLYRKPFFQICRIHFPCKCVDSSWERLRKLANEN